jgi:flagellar assembly factor FliW
MTTMLADETTAIQTELPVIDLTHPMPGFPDDLRFALVDLDGSGQLCSLTSLDHEELRFLVAPPATFFPDYAVDIDDATVAELDITSTANLKAPVVLNTANRRACQVIVDDAELPISAPLVA